MAFSYLDEKNLKDFVHDSDEYMRPFFEPIAEYERLSRAQPGRIPKGKPRVTDGTLAAITRETPKQIIQQLPTGKVNIKGYTDLEPYVNGILTDEILLNANSGGTPYAKSKNAIKDVIRNGASAAYVFYNRRGDKFTADFRRVYIKDIGFEKGKVSEFDTNAMKMTAWYTPMDIKAIIYWQQKLKKMTEERGEKFEELWDLKVLQALLDMGISEKDEEHKSEEEKKKVEGTSGYIRLDHCFQIGQGAKFFTYSYKLDKIAKTSISKDPRGIMPIHLLVPEEDYANPIGEALLAISAGKQNLLDFDMQMYQYSEGLQYSPPVKKWGNVPTSAIKLVPDAVIDMGATKDSGTDFEVVDISNRAKSNFAQNYGLIKSQILNESGRTGDSSISSASGNPGFSKTSRGVEQLQHRIGVSDNDLRKSYENWFGRICETMLNLHFAESQGMKELELKVETLKRLERSPEDVITMDYDKDYGPITFTVDASSSEAADNEKESERLLSLLEIKAKYTQGQTLDDKTMLMINQIIRNSGVDNPEKLLYTDEEIQEAKDMMQHQKVLQQQSIGAEAEALQASQDASLLTEDMEGADVQDIPPEAEETESELNEDELETIQILQERGLPDEDIATALTMLRNDYPDEEIAQVLIGGTQ